MEKFRKVRSKLIAVAKFPTPQSTINQRLRDQEEIYVPRFEDVGCQTESTFPSWIHVWDNPQLVEEQEVLSTLLTFDTQFQKEQREIQRKKLMQFQKPEDKKEETESNNNTNKSDKDKQQQKKDSKTASSTSTSTKISSHSEREFMRRLHCQEYKTLQKLREMIRQNMTEIGTSVYDLCAYKDIALTMTKERHTVGPVSDLVLMSSKLFRRCSDLSRSLATFFNITFADDFCDRDFDFTDQRMSKLALRRTEQELESVTKERDELRKRCRDAESRLLEYAKSQTVLKQQRDEAEARYTSMSQDMALLFQKSVDDVMRLEQESLKSTEMAMDAHNIVAPARSIAQQSVDNAIDKLSNVTQSLKSLHEDVSQIDFGGSMRTSIRNMEGLVNSCLSKMAHVRDGIRTSADQMRNEIQQRRKAVELSVLHVLAAEKMRTKLRHGREVLNTVREKAILCSDLVRASRIGAVERKKQLEERLTEEYFTEHPEHLPLFENNNNNNSYLETAGGGGVSRIGSPTSLSSSRPASGSKQHHYSQNQNTNNNVLLPNRLVTVTLSSSSITGGGGNNSSRPTSRQHSPALDILSRKNSDSTTGTGTNNNNHSNSNNNNFGSPSASGKFFPPTTNFSSSQQQNTQYQIMIGTSSNKKQLLATALKQFQLQYGGSNLSNNNNANASSSYYPASNVASGVFTPTTTGATHLPQSATMGSGSVAPPPPPPILVISPPPPPVYLIPPEPFDMADQFSMHMTNLVSTITNATSMLSHEDELTDIVDSLTCSIPQAAVGNNKNSLSVLRQQQQILGQGNGGGSAVVPLGRELMDTAIENNNVAMMNNNNSNLQQQQQSGSSTNVAFKQFAEMAQFMREMFEERIRELEEIKQQQNTAGGGASSSSPSSAGGGDNFMNNTNNITLNSKTDAEMLEEQAVGVLEGWRKRRRGESNLGRIQIADALRELDVARKVRRQKHEEELKKEGISKRFEFGGGVSGRQRHHHGDDDDDFSDGDEGDDDVAETPSLVIDVSQVRM